MVGRELQTIHNTDHPGGEYTGHHEDIVKVFLKNFDLYRRGGELTNKVDKTKGYVV